MFDYINHEIECPTCGKPVKEFQTKDTSCNLEHVNYWDADHFYTTCDYCDTWIDFYRIEPKPYVPIEHYEIRFTPSEKSEKSFLRNEDGKIFGYKFNGGRND